MYISYTAAHTMCGLETLRQRSENRCLEFDQKYFTYPKMKNLSGNLWIGLKKEGTFQNQLCTYIQFQTVNNTLQSKIIEC